MKRIQFLLLALAIVSCSPHRDSNEPDVTATYIDDAIIAEAIDSVKAVSPGADVALLEKGVRHAALLWRDEDGIQSDFVDFVKSNYISGKEKRKEMLNKVSSYIEAINGNYYEMTMELSKNVDQPTGEIDEIDKMFSNYSPSSHVLPDLYSNKIAFMVALNFPYYTLEEKEKLGAGWSRDDWAMARMGDMFVSRVPAETDQALSTATGNAEMYIAGFNIHMGKLRTDDGKQLFPDNMILLSHWNLRDELKADYSDKEKGKEKQEMIYKVMERIIYQEIPEIVINSSKYEWYPYSNKVIKGGSEIAASPEPDTRYEHIINIFTASKDVDFYSPEMNTYILRKFSVEMEIAQEEVEALFDSYLSSPLLIDLGKVIQKRIGRDLRPYDIWYDGFKTRSTIPEDLLTSKTSSLYPGPAAFKNDMPAMLKKLGWSQERATYLTDKIVVDPARGSGGAWGATMKGAVSHLRTRISDKGMDYKGYNIAVHEFGHNVEQTISLYDVDNYMMAGVPNTAFTEALAFVFQSRDLMLLGMKESSSDVEKMNTPDAGWSLMEIMGVGMVEMKVWKWLYENPEATPAQLKETVVNNAVEVWNKYFAPVFGVKDVPVLAIYSHMIEVPLYLPNYSYGQIIEFQIEEYLKGKMLSDEIDRIYKQGRLTPQLWMKEAVGEKISAQPVLTALKEALK